MLHLAALALAQDVQIRDSLATGTTATAVYGGTFTGAGWRVDDDQSRLYWDFGTQVSRGQVEFVVSDVTLANLLGDNNEFIQLFDTGDKWSCTRAITVRAYGDLEASSWGDIKLKTWDNTSGLYSEARGGVQVWDGLPHTYTVTWDATTATLARDGVVIVSLDVTGQDLRVGTMWLPLNTWNYGYSHPIGSTYSGLRVDAWEPGEDEPDTTVPDDGGRLPIEDVGVVEAYGDAVYDASEDLPLEGNTELSYLLYDLSDLSGRVTSATLRLHAPADPHAEGDGGTVYAVGATGWTESTLTWAARPTLGAAIGSFGAVSAGGTVDVDVTAGVAAGGRVALAIANGGANGAHFSSKEGGAGPTLYVTVVPDEAGEDPEDTGAPDEGAPDQGAPDQDTADTGRPALEARDKHLDLGCGCASGSGGTGWAALALAAIARRRRGPAAAASSPRPGPGRAPPG